MSRVLRTGMRFLRRLLFLLAVLAFAGLALSGSNPRPRTFEEKVPIMGTWAVEPVYNNFIGYPMTVTYRVFIPVGARLDLSRIPDVGDRFDLFRFSPCPPSFKDYSDPDWGKTWGGGRDNYGGDVCTEYVRTGDVEVRERSIRSWVQGNQQVFEVTYTLQYLLPIDFTKTFTEKTVRSPVVAAIYFRFYPNGGRTRLESSVLLPMSANFYLARRIDESSSPIQSLLLVVRKPFLLPHLMKLTAVGIVVGTAAAQGWVGLRRRFNRRRGAGFLVRPDSAVVELYEQWQKSRDYRCFLEAIQRYREGYWGRPRPIDWLRTTFILYSGRLLTDAQVREIFTYLISLEQEKGSGEEIR